MLKNGAIMQVGQVVRNLDRQMETLYRDFGLGPFNMRLLDERTIIDSRLWGKPSSHSYLCAVCRSGGVQFEMMQPLAGRSIYDDYMDSHGGEGLQHCKIYYRDVKSALAGCEEKGYRVSQSGGIGEDLFYYLDTEGKTGGLTLEIGNAGSVPPPDRVYPPGSAGQAPLERRPRRDGDIIQIGQVVRDIEKTMEVLHRDFGIGPFNVRTFNQSNHQNPLTRGKPNDHTFRCASVWVDDNLQYELMQPLTGRSIYNEFLDARGEGLHHLKLYFQDVEKAMADCQAKGYSVTQSGGLGDDLYYYLDTEKNCAGLIIELGNAGKVPPPDYVYPAP